MKSEVADYVLRKPAPDQREALHACIEQSLKASDLFIEGAMDRALAAIHAKPPRPKPPRKEPSSGPKDPQDTP